MSDDPRISASLRLDRTFVAIQSDQSVHCMLELEVPPTEAQRERPRLNLALVLDRSGSMAGEKLEWMKEAASHLIRRLMPDDRLSIVTFDTEVQLEAPLAPVNVDEMIAAVHLIDAGDSTNLSGGWLKGVEELRRSEGNGPRKVVLLTDGQANVGIVNPTDLASMSTSMREAAGIGTTTVGFGSGFQEDLLSAMADGGGGNAHFVERPDMAPAIFEEEFGDLASIVAQNVSVEIRPSDEVMGLGVMNEFPQVPVPGGIQVQLGDAYGNERRRVVFRFDVPGLAELGRRKIADIVLRYVSVGDRVEQHEVTMPLEVNLVSSGDPQADIVDRDVTDEVVVLRAAMAQRQAMEHLDEGRVDEARKLLDEAAEELERSAPGSPQEAELRERSAKMRRRSSEIDDGYTPEMRKGMRYEERSMRIARLDDEGKRKRR